jgi:hypothetical protein
MVSLHSEKTFFPRKALWKMNDQRFLEWERALAAEKSAKSRGSASIKLEALDFQRNSDERNTRRLRNLFRKGSYY